MCQQARAENLTIRYREKQIDVTFSCVQPVIDYGFRHSIVNVVCGSTATFTMLWENLSSITGQTNEKLTSINSYDFDFARSCSNVSLLAGRVQLPRNAANIRQIEEKAPIVTVKTTGLAWARWTFLKLNDRTKVSRKNNPQYWWSLLSCKRPKEYPWPAPMLKKYFQHSMISVK